MDWRILRYIDYISPNETELEKIKLGGIQLIKQDSNLFMSLIPGSIENKLKLKKAIEDSSDSFELIEALLIAFYTASSSLKFLYKMGEHGSILFYPEMSSDGTIIVKKI